MGFLKSKAIEALFDGDWDSKVSNEGRKNKGRDFAIWDSKKGLQIGGL